MCVINLGALTEKTNPSGLFLYQVLENFGRWKFIKSSVYFECFEMLTVIAEPFFRRDIFGIKNADPFFIVKAGATQMNGLFFHWYKVWQFSQKKLRRFFTPVCFLSNDDARSFWHV